jgi:hypothetical protein
VAAGVRALVVDGTGGLLVGAVADRSACAAPLLLAFADRDGVVRTPSLRHLGLLNLGRRWGAAARGVLLPLPLSTLMAEADLAGDGSGPAAEAAAEVEAAAAAAAAAAAVVGSAAATETAAPEAADAPTAPGVMAGVETAAETVAVAAAAAGAESVAESPSAPPAKRARAGPGAAETTADVGVPETEGVVSAGADTGADAGAGAGAGAEAAPGGAGAGAGGPRGRKRKATEGPAVDAATVADRVPASTQLLARPTAAELRQALLRGVDAVLIAGPWQPQPLLLACLRFLRPSRPFVVYCPELAPLTQCFSALRRLGMARGLSLAATWARKHQVMTNATHPEMTMDGASGYMLWGTTVCHPYLLASMDAP